MEWFTFAYSVFQAEKAYNRISSLKFFRSCFCIMIAEYKSKAKDGTYAIYGIYKKDRSITNPA